MAQSEIIPYTQWDNKVCRKLNSPADPLCGSDPVYGIQRLIAKSSQPEA
jgi:hypothetical protein